MKEIKLPLSYQIKFLEDCLKDDIRQVREARETYKEDPSPLNKYLLEQATAELADTKKAIKELIYGKELHW